MSLTKDQSIYAGSSKTLRVTVYDDDSALLDLTGSTVYFTVRQSIGAATTEITKTSATVSEIEILTQSGTTLGQADIKLVPGDTSALTIGLHFYDVWIELAGGERHVVIPPSDFRILQPITVL